MANSIQASPVRRPHWGTAVPMLALALGLGLCEFAFPRWANELTITSRILFRGFVVFLGVIGLIQLAAAWSPTRGAIATPVFGKHRMVLPMEGIVYLTIMFALFTGAMLTRSNMLLLVFALMAGPFVINGWMTFGMLQSARVARNAPRCVMVGELFGVELILSNSRPLLSIWIMSVRDMIQNVSEELSATVLFARVPPRSSQSGQYQLQFARRGLYQLGPLLTFSRFPLGLVERSRLFHTPGEILVYPRIGRLSSAFRRRWIGATELVARPQPHSGMFHDEFLRMREFRTGDNPRDIHWRSSARRGELILREYQQNRDFNLAVILDFWQPLEKLPENVRGTQSELLEQTLSFAATIIVEHGRTCRDANITFAASGTSVFRWQGQGTSAGLESLFDGLAVLEPGPARECAGLVEDVLQRSNGTTKIILISTRPADKPLPYANQMLSSRVDCLRMDEINFEEALIFDESGSGGHLETRGDV